MIRNMFLSLALLLLVAGFVFILFQNVNPVLLEETGPTGDARSALIAEIILLVVSFVLFIFLIEYRMLVLICLLVGQMILFFVDDRFHLGSYVLPVYGLIAINGVIFLILYFLCSSHLWAPESMKPEDFDPDIDR